MAIWNFALATGATMGSVIGGYIAQDLGWRYNYGIAAIGLGLLWFGFIFFLPETVFIRDMRYNLDEQSHEDLSGGFEKTAEGDAVQAEDVPTGPTPPPQSCLSTLKPWTGKLYDRTSAHPYFPVADDQIISRSRSAPSHYSFIPPFAGQLSATEPRLPGLVSLASLSHKFSAARNTTLPLVRSVSLVYPPGSSG